MFLPTTRRDTAGVTIVECLVALVLLSIGVLSAAGTVGASARLLRTGDEETAAARRVLSIVDSLRAAVARGGGTCASLSSGSAQDRGIEVNWATGAAASGAAVELTVAYPGRAHRDTVATRIGCR